MAGVGHESHSGVGAGTDSSSLRTGQEHGGHCRQPELLRGGRAAGLSRAPRPFSDDHDDCRRASPRATNPVAVRRADGGELFLAWVKQGLVPRLQRDDGVILDNLATHKVAGVRTAIEAAGARLEYLPP